MTRRICTLVFIACLASGPALAGDTVAAKRDDMTDRFHAACDDLVGNRCGLNVDGFDQPLMKVRSDLPT